MNFKELIEVVAKETNISEAQVRKVGEAILAQFSELIEKQENFRSQFITFDSSTLPAKPEAEGKPGMPERKIARMKIKVKKDKPSAE